MNFRKRIIKNKILSFPLWLGGVFFVALVLLGLRMVFAGSDTKTIYIFPTAVTSSGWENRQNTMEQDLSPRAVFSDFNVSNSASVVVEAGADVFVGNVGGSNSSDTSLTGGSENTSANIESGEQKPAVQENIQTETMPTENGVLPEVEDETSSPAPSETPISSPDIAPAPEAPVDVPANIQSFFENIFTPTFAEEIPKNETSTEPVASEVNSVIEAAPSDSSNSSTEETPKSETTLDPIAPDTTPSVSETITKNDQGTAVCEIKGKVCHTMELSGFGVAGGASLGDIKNVQLRLSLGAKGEDSAALNDQLFVKYFYKGQWFLADSIVLNREISNVLNGGHFLYALPEIASWDDLSGIKVSIEYDRNSNAKTEVYLDSAWLDVAFRSPDQNENLDEGGNVSSVLRSGEESNNPDILPIGAGKKIYFAYGNEATSRGLVVKTDKSVYEGLSEQVVYFSVTNTTESENNFDLGVYFPESGGEVKNLRKWTRNVPYESTVSDYRPLTYFCEEGWMLASSSEKYQCVSTFETENCDSLNTDKTNCTVKNTRISGTKETNYQNVWKDAVIREETGTNYLKNIQGLFRAWKKDEAMPFRAKQTFQGSHSVFPGQTLYFAMDISYPANSRGRFFIETKGGDSFGLIGPKWQGGWKYRMPIVMDGAVNGSEYYVEIDAKNSDFWKSVKEDGGDVRFITAGGKEFSYWISEWDIQKKHAGIWIQYDKINSAESVFLYYGNKNATSASDPLAPFAHDTLTEMFRATNSTETAYIKGFSVISLTDDNEVKLTGYDPVTLNRGEVATFKSFNQTSLISAKGPVMAYALDGGRNIWEPIASLSYDGTIFGQKEFSTEFALPEDASELQILCTNENPVSVEVLAPNRSVLQTGVCDPSGKGTEAGELILGSGEVMNFPAGSIIDSGDSKMPFLASMKGVGEKKTEKYLSLFGAPQSRGSSPSNISISFGKEELSPVPTTIDDSWAELDILDASKKRENDLAEDFKYPKVNDLLDARKDFNAKDVPEFRFKYKLQRNGLVQFARGFFTDRQFNVKSVYISHETLGDVSTAFDVVYGANDEWTLKLKSGAGKIRPGKYTLKVEMDEGGSVFTDEMNFYWGVLAVNTTKAEYRPGESVEIDMAALSPNGNTLCDANLALAVVNPMGVAYDVPISKSGLCNGNNVVSVPDYSAEYQTKGTGSYTVKLSRFDDNGDFISSATNTFEVKETVPFEITRTGPTRIYPVAPYEMKITVRANQSFSGVVREKLPDGFTLTDSSADTMTQADGGIELNWNANMVSGDTRTFTYSFDAPDVSPYLYLMPALRFLESNASTTGSALFTESRNWQIASDATGQMFILWDKTWTPTGWGWVSSSTGEFSNKFFRGAAAYATAGLGAMTHTPTASAVVNDTTLATTENRTVSTSDIADVTHSHTFSPTVGPGSNLPSFRTLRVLKYNSAGEPATLPGGAILFFDATVTAGWTRYSAQDGYYVFASTTIATTGGSNTHQHTITGTTNNNTGTVWRRRNGAANGADNPHAHTVSSSTVAVNSEPAYINTILGQLNATSTISNDIISMWNDTPESGWTTLSDVGGPFYQKFPKPAATYGGTGGADTHVHADENNILSSTPTGTADTANAGVFGASSVHRHLINVTNFSTSANLPPYNDVIFAKRRVGIPVFTQSQYGWYVNESANTPTDPWPVGTGEMGEDSPITVLDAPPGPTHKLRLRMSLISVNATTTVSTQAFRLQYGEGTDCTTVSSWKMVGDTSSTTVWRGYDNGGISDGATLDGTVLSLSSSTQSYEETNDTISNPVEIGKNTSGEWDWVLQNNYATSSTNYCFRMVHNDGTVLEQYDGYPQLITNAKTATSTVYTPFDNERLASTSPWFDFASEDPEANDLQYQIQIDDNADFSSLLIDNTSTSTPANFQNMIVPSDKAPYNSANRIRFIPGSALTNGTTYWWRVRAIDPNGSNEYGPWITPQSVTINTANTISTWYQTTWSQFATDSLVGTRASTTQNLVEITPPGTSGSITSSPISFSSGSNSTATAWGSLSWNHAGGMGTNITYQIEYYTSTSSWNLIPETDIPGNSVGLSVTPVNLLALDETVYSIIRLKASFTATGVSPVLYDWTLAWGSRVSTPVVTKLFDNEKTGTTTPTFEFSSSDPQSDNLEYQFQWSSSSPTFTASSTLNSTGPAAASFVNVTNGGDTHPFTSGNVIQFTLPSGYKAVNGTTYWWRVRAIDPAGGNVYSLWSDARSFTVDTTVTVSTWHQTTSDQFNTDTYSNTISYNGSALVATTSTEVMIGYGEGTVQTPRYRFWSGTVWGSEMSAESVGAAVKWVVLKESPKRDEYIMATIGADARVKAQVYKNGAWGNVQTIANTVSTIDARGVDIAYESSSGDAMVVACDGDTNPSYYKWDGTAWGTVGTLATASAANCAWIKLASDPVSSSNEIAVMMRNISTGYNALIWSGAAWGNATTLSTMTETSHEGIGLEYEESGGQLVALSSRANNAGFQWKSWSGAAWSGATNVAGGDDFENGTLKRDVGSDNMSLCLIDNSLNISAYRWTGAGFAAVATLAAAAGNDKNGRPVDCEFETNGARDGYIMANYSDATGGRYRAWTGAAWAAQANVSTIQDSYTVQTRRTGDGKILSAWFDDVNSRYEFSYWNGTIWSPFQSLETSPSNTSAPFGEPFMMAPSNESLSGRLTSSAITYTDGDGPFWDKATSTHTKPAGSSLLYQIEYYSTSTGAWALIPDVDLMYNSTGTSTLPINIRPLNKVTYGQIRLVANFTCASVGNCPSVQDWTVTWSAGITIAGTIKQFDQSTNVTSGTVAVARNGTLTGKTGVISGTGTWSIANVNVGADDVITVFVTGAANANEAVGVTIYNGTGDMSGMNLFERHLSLGSDDNQIISNADISAYDYTASGNNEDIFDDVDAGNDLTVCGVTGGAGCFDASIYIKVGNTYRPDSANSGNVTTHDITIKGSVNADANTINVFGSWLNTGGSFTAGTGSVILKATSTTESINSTGATGYDFYNLTLGQTSGTAVWNLSSLLVITNDLAVTYGSLAQNGANTIDLAGNLAIGASGGWLKGTATTTFNGVGTKTWTDSTVVKQDLGLVLVDGTSKTIQFGSNVKAQNVTIGADDILDANTGNFGIEVTGNWHNDNAFLPHSGTVTFSTTTPSHTIATGASNFYNVVFQGAGGTWQFVNPNATTTNNFTITSGTTTLPTTSLAVGGSFQNNGGAFNHSNAVLRMTSTVSGKFVKAGGSDFYNLIFNGSGGAWTMTDASATTTNDLTITAGGVTLPSGRLTVGSSFQNTGGSFAHNTGTVKMTSAAGGKFVTPGASSFYNILFAGTGGAWTFGTANVTVLGNYSISAGAVTNPTGTLTLTGSYLTTGGTFAHANGTVLMNATTTGKFITAGTSPFYILTCNSAAGGWTVTGNATTTNNFNLTAANAGADSFTQNSGTTFEVGGTFTNLVGDVPTKWTGSTLFLNSHTTYSMNAKTSGSDVYSTLRIGTSTKVSGWNSSANVQYLVDPTGYLYLQDHGSVDGDLYIWGTYTRSSGTEYWDYAKDFDGAILAGSSRSVQVRFGDGATSIFSGGTFEIVGGAGATTTIANQGAGNYAVSVTGGTLNAQYYQFKNMASGGLTFTNAPTVSSLSYGEFELSSPGGSMMTIASTTINANPLKQITNVGFATSTGIASGYNVTELGAATSNWWFKNASGNYWGESHDDDPGPNSGNPGYIKWDDSAYTISVAGTVFALENSSPDLAVCATPNVVKIAVQGGSTYSGNCSVVNGTYSIPNVAFTGDVALTVFLDTNGGTRAATVTKTPTGDLTGIDLYDNRVIVRHEDVSPITIADMASYDSSDDSDIPFMVTLSSPNTLIVEPETELHVWDGKTFVPGGNVTLRSGGSGNVYDGRLHIGNTSVFTAAGTESHSVGGGFQKDAGSTFTAANSTFTFTATTTGKTIIGVALPTFYNLVFNGTGGGWGLSSSVAVSGNLTPTAGTISGTGSLVVTGANVAGDAVFNMTGGTVTLSAGGNFGGANDWKFYGLTLSGASATTTKIGTNNIEVRNNLNISANHGLDAGNDVWTLTGGGSAFTKTGYFNSETSLFKYASTTATNITAAAYYQLELSPSSIGSPTYTILGGVLTVADTMTIGNGTNGVSVNATTNDPDITVAGNFLISAGATYTASNSGGFTLGGNFTNNGTFAHGNGTVTMNASAIGKTITASSSPFSTLNFNNAAGGWTILGNATTTSNFTLASASSFTQTSGTTLEVRGTFTNGIAGANTEWNGSTLYLNSGTSFSMNTKDSSGDSYNTLRIGTTTNVKMWNSTSTVYTLGTTGSLYSQDHNGTNGSLSIWGTYPHSSGAEYWSYATDFDGTDISGTPRVANVRFASGASATISGGTFEILGASGATTTINNQGSGNYSLNISGGTFNAQYYQVRNIGASGLNLTGSPLITTLSDGDFELTANGGTLITAAASVITANPLKTFMRMRFATTTAIGGFNVTATGATVESWRFNDHTGNLSGEKFDVDPGGDPGYLVWDDSNGAITVSGYVYSGEGSGVSSVCDGSTQVVRLLVQGINPRTASCDGTGFYTITNVAYNPLDIITVYLNSNGGKRAVTVAADPTTNIGDMNLYESRVIVRHQDVFPITIANLAGYDSSDDSDIPFTATLGSPNTLVVMPEIELHVWAGKTFTPGGNVTLQSGGSGNVWDGRLHVDNNASFIATGSESHSIGGSFQTDTGATFTSANSTFTFTATTTAKVILGVTPLTFASTTFNGVGGAWTFSNAYATTTGNFTITNGSTTLPTTMLSVGGSFQNNGGTFTHSGGTIKLTSIASGKFVRGGGSDFSKLLFDGVGGAWSMSDTNATTTSDFTVLNGTVTLPSGILAIGGSFDKTGGTFTHNSGTVKMTATASGKTIFPGNSPFYNLLFSGVGGAWTFTTANATTSNNFSVAAGTTTLPQGTLEVGGSFDSSVGKFVHASGTVLMKATATGKAINPGTSLFYDLTLNSSSGGWTLNNATTSNNFSLTAASLFTQTSATTLEVKGRFTNGIAGANTTWTGSTLYLNSATNYSINTKTLGGDAYNILKVGANTDIQMWNSSAGTYTVDASGSLYSQDHATSGDGYLYIWGDYNRSSGGEYWDYTKDFDGAALGGSPRVANIRFASGASVTISGGTFEMIGTATATTSVDYQSSGTYALNVSGGTLNASYYKIRNTGTNGLNLSGTPTITSLSYGDLELGTTGGSSMTVDETVINQNAGLTISNMRFATSSGVTSGWNVTRTGTTINAWTFNGTTAGNYYGESYDQDGGDDCGAIRWNNSACLFLDEPHYRWRADNGAEGVPTANWYDSNWSKRKKIRITNPTGNVLTNFAVKVEVKYDADMQSDFDDLRFTDSTGTSSVNYWIESYISSGTSTVWVKVPSIPASSAADVYVYYGNVAVSTTGSASGVFTFYDGFEDNNITEYSGDTSLFNTGTSFNREWAYGLDAFGNTTQKTTNGIYRTGAGSTIAQGSTIRFFEYVDTTAGTDDESCTLFGVQSAGNNYALCFEVFSTDHITIGKNITNNDTSGTQLATTNVTWVTGWYEAVIDWKTDNTITANVYNSSGSLFATVNTTDSSYTTGGVGFTFWGQHGGWDYYTGRQYISSTPTYTTGLEQINGGATWLADEDTALSNQSQGTTLRLRFSLANTGTDLSNQQFMLETASRGAYSNCASVPATDYTAVPTYSGAGCGTATACMSTSTNISNHEVTGELLSPPAITTFVPGEVLEDPSNAGNSMSMSQNKHTEMEYTLKLTNYAIANAYCFRVSNNGTDLDSYSKIAEVGLLFSPTISNLKFNDDSPITLIGGTTKHITATASTTDYNGWSDITSATSTFYRTTLGANCVANENNCYQITSANCSISNCSGNICSITCGADINFFADPTDAGDYVGQDWTADITVADLTGLKDTDSSVGVQLLTLRDVTASPDIDYGPLNVGSTTESTNQVVTLRNTGNSPINVVIEGTDMVGSTGSIPVTEQKYATSTFTYASCSICQFLTGSSVQFDVDLPKPLNTTPVTDQLYWGLNIPVGTKAETFTGVINFGVAGA